ncbi:MAG: flagellar basal body-associated FliL family protein [Campylobacterota bacterium]|nr:flagellar basal body-associated FliL family protein [Campylobacterota bacterium]
MAEEESNEEVKKSGGDKGMIIVLALLVVLLLAAVGGLAYFMYSKGMFDPEAQAGQAQTEQQAATQIEEEEAGETFMGEIDGLVLNITDAKGRAKLMKLSFSLKTIEPSIAQIVEINKAQMIDAVIRQISARSSEELLTVGGKAMLKEEMIEEINGIINDVSAGNEDIKRDCVKDIFFTSFVIK